ncbi:MAG: hypothetical protein Q9208_004650 [Pyrenodesmia sp. 3 TL-2023]
MASQNHPPVSFLSLPFEVRTAIYTHLVPAHVMISSPRPSYERACHPFALTYACRTTRTEFLSLLYGRTRIAIDLTNPRRAGTREAYHDWVAKLDMGLAALITKLEVFVTLEVERELKWDDSWACMGGWVVMCKRVTQKIMFTRVHGEFELRAKEVRCERSLRFPDLGEYDENTAEGRLRLQQLLPEQQSGGVALGMDILLARLRLKINAKRDGRGVNAVLGREGIRDLVETLLRHESLDTRDERIACSAVGFVEDEDGKASRRRTILGRVDDKAVGYWGTIRAVRYEENEELIEEATPMKSTTERRRELRAMRRLRAFRGSMSSPVGARRLSG